MIFVTFAFATFLYMARQTFLAVAVLALMSLVFLGYVDVAALGTPGEWDALIARPGMVEPTLAPATALLAVFWILFD